MQPGGRTHVHPIRRCTENWSTELTSGSRSRHWESLWLSDFIPSGSCSDTALDTSHSWWTAVLCRVAHTWLPATFFFQRFRDWGCGSDSSRAASQSHHEPQGTTGLATICIFLIYFMKTRQLRFEMQGFVMNSPEKPFPGILSSPKPKPRPSPCHWMAPPSPACPRRTPCFSHLPALLAAAWPYTHEKASGITLWGQLHVTDLEISETEVKQ